MATLTHQFIIADFQKKREALLPGEGIKSRRIMFQGLEFQMKVFPSGSSLGNQDHLSVFLYNTASREVLATATFALMDSDGPHGSSGASNTRLQGNIGLGDILSHASISSTKKNAKYCIASKDRLVVFLCQSVSMSLPPVANYACGESSSRPCHLLALF